MNKEKVLIFDRWNHKVGDYPNPNLSEDQTAFEAWCRRQNCNYNLERNFYVPYHGNPFSEDELFGEITASNYYSDPKTQGAWDGWRARTEHAVSL